VCETNQLPSCGAKVMNEWSCTSTLHIYIYIHVFMACIESPLPLLAIRWSRSFAISILFMRYESLNIIYLLCNHPVCFK